MEKFSPNSDEIARAKRYIVSSLKTTGDSQTRIMDFNIGQILAEDNRSLEEILKSINEIDNLENTFKRLEINTVFSLESEQYA